MPLDNCPRCGVSLVGPSLPEGSYCDDTCPQPCRKNGHVYGRATHARREIGVEVSQIYDGVLFWMCPDCKHRWHRWSEESDLWHEALAFLK